MRIIALESDVARGEVVDVEDSRVENNLRGWPGQAIELFLGLVEMVQIEVCVTASPDELPGRMQRQALMEEIKRSAR